METPYIFYDNKLGVGTQFLVADINKHENSLQLINYRALRSRLNSKTSPEKELRKASWSGPALVQFHSLCKEWKEQLIMKFGNPPEKIRKSYFAQHYTPDRKAFDIYVGHTYGDNQKLDLKLVEKYVYQASVLNTVLKIKQDRRTYAKALGVTSLDIWQSLSNDVNSFREVEHGLPTTKDSLRRKATQYAKEGYVSLISGKLQNNNAAKITNKEQMALLDELIAKHTNLDNEVICGIYNTVANQINWPTITAKTVANRKTKSNLVTYAGRNGSSALSDKLLMQTKRSKPSAPMLYWTLDGWDVELLYQKTTINKKGRKVTTYHNRLAIVAVLDPFNKYPIGYAIGTHETPQLIKEAIQNAMNHTKELFGDYYKPYQIQSDRYSVKKLTPLYQAASKRFTPAKAKNGKSKVIEPYFSTLNKNYARLYDNWSGYNVDSGSKNQPNDEMLYKMRHSFPDEKGCYQQIVSIMETERTNKIEEFKHNWDSASTEFKQKINTPEYLLLFGLTTGFTNKLRGDGINITINGQKFTYDSFDIEFRKLSHLDWEIHYDSENLNHVLAVSENGKYRFMLEKKYIQPMALADRKEGDAEELLRTQQYNKEVVNYITEQRQEKIETVHELFRSKPELNDTLAKLILVDSNGQHKNRRNEHKEINSKALELLTVKNEEQQNTIENNFRQSQAEYVKNKVNFNDYL
ncbi:hypothetical protein [Aquimarina algiphila]|uniref:hypothetical protein n=1 Tax=Aquimarina algiphila TaxID=2047982 RepID=UPI002330E4FC|nr:hypothetical protein [Aquimarina algiphila]